MMVISGQKEQGECVIGARPMRTLRDDVVSRLSVVFMSNIALASPVGLLVNLVKTVQFTV